MGHNCQIHISLLGDNYHNLIETHESEIDISDREYIIYRNFISDGLQPEIGTFYIKRDRIETIIHWGRDLPDYIYQKDSEFINR